MNGQAFVTMPGWLVYLISFMREWITVISSGCATEISGTEFGEPQNSRWGGQCFSFFFLFVLRYFILLFFKLEKEMTPRRVEPGSSDSQAKTLPLGHRRLILTPISINLIVFYHECRSLIGYATRYLFCDR